MENEFIITLIAQLYTMLERNSPAPPFSAYDQDGNPISLNDFRGSKIALYFYPKDNTETCTKQACNLRDNHAYLLQNGITVVGISPDTVRSHDKFAQRYDLPFRLVADTDHRIAEAYGVWRLKKMMGREYMGVVRTTFIIDENGIIERVIEKVAAKDHAAQLVAN